MSASIWTSLGTVLAAIVAAFAGWAVSRSNRKAQHQDTLASESKDYIQMWMERSSADAADERTRRLEAERLLEEARTEISQLNAEKRGLQAELRRLREHGHH